MVSARLLVSASSALVVEGYRLKVAEGVGGTTHAYGHDAQRPRQQQQQASKKPWSRKRANGVSWRFHGEPGSRSGRSKAVDDRMLYRGGVSFVNLIKNPDCNQYEMCQCNLGDTERSTQCRENSCVFAPLAPFYCHKFARPDCNWGNGQTSLNWAHCEFANTLSTEFYPGGNGIFVSLRPAQVFSPTPQMGNLVLVDIDDTMICSGGVPSGVLRDCAAAGTKKKGVFPGAVAFFYALTQGTLSTRLAGKNIRKPIPMTARPGELRLLLGLDNSIESTIRGTFKELENAFIQHGPPEWNLDTENAQYGSVVDFQDATAVIGHRSTDATEYDKFAHRKFSAYKRMYDQDFNVSSVVHRGIAGSFFVGDNGQGDLIAAQMMLQYGPINKRGLKAAFIHDAARRCSNLCRSKWSESGIYVFDDYAQAAVIAESLQFITSEDRNQVCAETADYFPCTKDRADKTQHDA